jgi:membrane protein DedA with SNARE-associated domain
VFNWITGLIKSNGYLGIAFLMLAENVFPPIPSELIMPLAGFTAGQGQFSLLLVILAGSVGSLAGTCFWYWIGVKIGTEGLKRFSDQHGRWLTLSRKDIERADAWFDRHGHWAVLVGRLIPAVRTLISVPAGMSGMSFGRFMLHSAIGTVAWTSLLALAGFWLQGSYAKIAAFVGPASNAIVAVIVIWYLYRVVTFRSSDASD